MTPEREEIIKKAIANYPWFGSYSSWTIYQECKTPVDGVWTQGAFWLGVRTHDMAETNHDYVVRITKEEAQELLTKDGRKRVFLESIWQHFIKWELPDYPLPEVKKPSYDDITPGYWYINSKYQEGWWIAKVEIKEGVKVIILFGDGGTCHIGNYDIDQFIKKVPKPD